MISIVLCISGIASFIGVRTGGIAADRIGPNRAIPLALILLAASLFLMSALYGFAYGPAFLPWRSLPWLCTASAATCLILPSSIG